MRLVVFQIFIVNYTCGILFQILFHYSRNNYNLNYMQIEMLSWGYLLQRGTVLGIHVQNQLSRIPGGFPDRHGGIPEDIIEGGYMVEKNSDITIGGRIVLNLWRILRVEVDFYFLRLTNQFLPF